MLYLAYVLCDHNFQIKESLDGRVQVWHSSSWLSDEKLYIVTIVLKYQKRDSNNNNNILYILLLDTVVWLTGTP